MLSKKTHRQADLEDSFVIETNEIYKKQFKLNLTMNLIVIILAIFTALFTPWYKFPFLDNDKCKNNVHEIKIHMLSYLGHQTNIKLISNLKDEECKFIKWNPLNVCDNLNVFLTGGISVLALNTFGAIMSAIGAVASLNTIRNNTLTMSFAQKYTSVFFITGFLSWFFMTGGFKGLTFCQQYLNVYIQEKAQNQFAYLVVLERKSYLRSGAQTARPSTTMGLSTLSVTNSQKESITFRPQSLPKHLLRQYVDEEQFKLFEQMTEFTREFHEACDNIKRVEKEITNELQKQININRKPQSLPEMYTTNLQPMNMIRKKLWYRLYKYWHEPFIEKNYDDDKLLLLKQQNAYKKRIKKRQQEKKLQNSKLKKSAQMIQMQQKEQDANDSDSVDLEMLIQEQQRQKNENDESNLTDEFMNAEDDPDNDEMAQIISKRVDPFNINHKKNQNLYRDTLLECIGLKPHKLIKNIALPQFYVRQHKKQRKSQQQKRELFDNFIQVCDPNKKRVKETKIYIQDKIKSYIGNIEQGINEKLNYLKTLDSVKQEIVSKSQKLQDFNGNGSYEKQKRIIKIEKIIRPSDYEEVFMSKRRQSQYQEAELILPSKFLSAQKKVLDLERRGSKESLLSERSSKTNRSNIRGNQLSIPQSKVLTSIQQSTMVNTRRNSTKQGSPANQSFRTPNKKENHNFETVAQLFSPNQYLEAKMPKYAKFNDNQSKYQLRKFHERIEQSSWKTDNNLAFQESRANRVNYPCLHTGTLLEKASETLKSKVAQAKIIKINKANQQEWLDQNLKNQKLHKIADGQIELGYDLDEGKQKYINHLKEELDSQDEDALEALNRSLSNTDDFSLKDFQAIAKQIKMTRLKSKESPKKNTQQNTLSNNYQTTRQQSFDKSPFSNEVQTPKSTITNQRFQLHSVQSARQSNGQKNKYGGIMETQSSISTSKQFKNAASAKEIVQNENVKKANELFGLCKDVLREGVQLQNKVQSREQKINLNFDLIKDRVSHNIQLAEDDVKVSVEDFHNKKHIFIYNKDLSKGYFLRIDPQRINEIARRLHTFKFKEPRIIAPDDAQAEIIEKQRLEKYYHKKFKSEDLDAKQLRPKYTEKFISKVQAVTEMCNMKLKEKLNPQNITSKKQR
ncbi:UNKNOWN [Stylonychia lemnae]|uniref:Transmembrane protein n=1 Tax=Stylonychia lemnae TaxID=5949 RepID=A0A077ZMZ4_STYLE|nr:UNKNOWN [Stylonychia lemnae]|eukprot:CDW71327.1 UNKNOWN [Stylonychia lemnae]